MKTVFRNSIVPVLISLLFACDTTNTSITANWRTPEKELTYHSVLVTALTNHPLERTTVETEMAATFGENGIHAVGGIADFPASFHANDADKAALMAEIQKTNTDAILTVSLLKKETNTRYTKGRNQYNPVQGSAYTGSFYNYYSHWYPLAYDNDYYKDDKTYYLETNLYDAKTEKLIWSGQSVTYAPVMLSDFAKEFAQLIVDRMKKDGVLSPMPATALQE
jgi:hypothetical protein